VNRDQSLDRVKGTDIVLRHDQEGMCASQRGRAIGNHSVKVLRQISSGVIEWADRRSGALNHDHCHGFLEQGRG
jgi:hypothetical protein